MTRTEEARALVAAVKHVIKNSPDDNVSRAAMKVQRLLTATPMTVILASLWPERSNIAKADALGVSKQTFYYWLDGTTRPNMKAAKKIARLTDYSVAEIRGHGA